MHLMEFRHIAVVYFDEPVPPLWVSFMNFLLIGLAVSLCQDEQSKRGEDINGVSGHNEVLLSHKVLSSPQIQRIVSLANPHQIFCVGMAATHQT